MKEREIQLYLMTRLDITVAGYDMIIKFLELTEQYPIDRPLPMMKLYERVGRAFGKSKLNVCQEIHICIRNSVSQMEKNPFQPCPTNKEFLHRLRLELWKAGLLAEHHKPMV